MKVLVTGTAGFIGHHVARRLISRGDEVVGLDNINAYYDVDLKLARLAAAGIDALPLMAPRVSPRAPAPVTSTLHPNYRFVRMDLEDGEGIEALFAREKFDRVCHLAAQAGVRYSLLNPRAYIDSNIVGFSNVIEACRRHGAPHLVYASSSSVYGLNESMPFSTRDNVDHPVSLYAATKKSNELTAHSYSHLYGLPTTGLRFFTVYGPWGRPDMALFLFTKAILEDKPIDVYNQGDMRRDFTYVDDVVEGVVCVLDATPAGDPSWSGLDPDPSSSRAPYRIYNIGRGTPIGLLDFIAALEKALGKKARRNLLPLQPGDVPTTWADVKDLETEFGYKPATSIERGIGLFVEWYLEYHNKPR